mmetsp:Transcript_30956/g.99874  ORF Transcript_30956/g.99874 Transcript_30956/m.99874 type:complete len:273 (+) Transcript_30956:101-919(+)
MMSVSDGCVPPLRSLPRRRERGREREGKEVSPREGGSKRGWKEERKEGGSFLMINQAGVLCFSLTHSLPQLPPSERSSSLTSEAASGDGEAGSEERAVVPEGVGVVVVVVGEALALEEELDLCGVGCGGEVGRGGRDGGDAGFRFGDGRVEDGLLVVVVDEVHGDAGGDEELDAEGGLVLGCVVEGVAAVEVGGGGVAARAEELLDAGRRVVGGGLHEGRLPVGVGPRVLVGLALEEDVDHLGRIVDARPVQSAVAAARRVQRRRRSSAVFF